MAVTFVLTGYPEAVDVHITVGDDRIPCVFCRNVFDKDFSSRVGAPEDKPFFKSVFHPGLFQSDAVFTFFVGDAAADMFPVNIFPVNSNIFHSGGLLLNNLLPSV